jgi:hypothetical protein
MKKALVVLLLIVAVAAGYLAHLGAFKSVKVTGEKMGPYNLLYVEQKGDYGQSGKSIMAVGDAVKALGVTPEAGFGVYFDNPRKVKKADLRAEVGVIVAAADLKKVAKLKKQFKSRKVAKQECLTAEMPFKGSLSIIIGIMKVYPVLAKEAEAKKLNMSQVMEIYVPGKTITYVMAAKK